MYEVISAKTCPYVQRVAITLREKGIPYVHKMIDLANKPDWFLKVSPFGKVPLLITPEGKTLFESQVINEYLDEIELPSLHPSDPFTKAENRAWIELISSTIMSFGGYYYAIDAETMEDRISLVKDKLARLEEAKGCGAFFNGDDFSLVDAAAAPLFSRIELLNSYHPIQILSAFPKLQVWSEQLLRRASVKAVATDEFQQNCIDALVSRGTYIARYLV